MLLRGRNTTERKVLEKPEKAMFRAGATNYDPGIWQGDVKVICWWRFDVAHEN
jgi:hypothetical protein